MSARVAIISSDCHIGLALPYYKQYLEARYHAALDEQIPRLEKFLGLRQGNQSAARKYGSAANIDRQQAFYDQVSTDNLRRIKELEADNVVGEVLFPNTGSVPFTGGFLGSSYPVEGEDLELALAGQRAHNRWLADFVDPSRQVGVALLNYADVEASIREVHRAADHGLRSVGLNGIQANVPPPWHESYTPLWNTIEDTGLPISIHAGWGTPPPSNFHSAGRALDSVAFALQITEGPFGAQRALWFFIWGGVLERHPKLKLVFTEQASGWIPRALRLMDWQWEYGPFYEETLIPLRPSEYWQRQGFVGTASMSRDEIAQRHDIGDANVMFGTDFPHLEGTFGRTVKFLNYVFSGSGVTETEVRAIIGENAARCYGLDMKVLQSLAEAVGPTIDELLVPSTVGDVDPQTAMWGNKPAR